MTKFKKVIAMLLALIMAFSSVSVLASAWSEDDIIESSLGINVDIYKEVDGAWVKTEKVKPGQAVKARVSLSTNYYSNDCELKVYYDTSFFDADATDGDIIELDTNPAAGLLYAIARLDGGAYYISVATESLENAMYDANTWLFEIPLTVKDGVSGEGKVYVDESDILTPDNQTGVINVPAGPEGGKELEIPNTLYPMNLWELESFEAVDGVVSTQSSVTFYANGGAFASGDPDKFVFTDEIGNSVTGVPAVSKEGYALFGWTESAESDAYADAPATVPELDAERYAYWVKKVNFEFNANGGCFDKDEDKTVKYFNGLVPEAAFEAPAAPEKTGYTFTGWDAEVPEEVPYAKSDDDYTVTFTATWALNVSMNFYSLEGDKDAFKSFDGYTGKEFAEEIGTPERKGYYFAGWTPEVPAAYPEASADYYAIWEKKTYEVRFFIDGKFKGTASYAYNEPVYVDIPTAKPYYGCKLTDWRIGSDEGEVFAEGTPMPDAKISLYAKNVILEDLPAVFMVDGEVYETTTADFEEKITLPTKGNPKKDGYDFLGWTPYVGIMDDAEGKTFTAVWKQLPLDVTFYVYNADGEYEIGEAYKVEVGEELDTPADPYTEGYTFLGWGSSEDAESGITAEEISAMKMGEEPISFYEVRKANSYTIKYDVDGGSAVTTPVTASFGETITLPSPTKEGYTFGGWLKGDDKVTVYKGDYEVPYIGEDGAAMEFTAKWDINKYKIKFVDYDASPIGEIEKEYNAEILSTDIPAHPTREGYTPNGWTTIPGRMPVSDDGTTVTALYEIEKYNVTFNSNGGSAVEGITDAEYGSEFKAPAEPKKDGYTFEYWYTLAGDTETEYKFPKDEKMPDLGASGDTLTLYAKWKANEYTITFESNGGSDVEPITAAYNSEISKPEPNPTLEGFDFAYWYETNENTPFVFDKMPLNGTTLYAKWNPADGTAYSVVIHRMGTDGQYAADDPAPNKGETNATVYFDDVKPTLDKGFKFNTEKSDQSKQISADGKMEFNIYVDRESYDFEAYDNGVKSGDTQSVLFGAIVPKPEPKGKYGNEFKYWYSDDEKTEFTGTMPAEDLTLYTKYSPETYEAANGVAFNAKGGKFADGSETTSVAATFGSKFTAPADPKMKGYKFEGYALSAEDGAEIVATTGANLPALDKDLDVDPLTYYAVWSAETYSADIGVKFDANGGEFADGTGSASVEATFGQAVVPPTAPEKYGYDFAGWTAVKNDGIIVAAPGANLPELDKDLNDGDTLTYFASWTAEKYAAENGVVFDANGGKYADGTGSASVAAVFGQAVVPPTAPVRAGYEFKGWTAVKDGAVVAIPGASLPELAKDLDVDTLTYFAKWSAKGDVSYKVNVYLMKADKNYELSSELSYDDSGVADAEVTYAAVTAKINLPDGFTLNEGISDASKTISGDGKMVFDVYADRNPYKAKFTTDNFSKEVEAIYGATYTAPKAPDKTGHYFVKWQDAEGNEPAEMPVGGASFTALYEKNTYQVKYFVETAEGQKFFDRYVIFDEVIPTDYTPTKGYSFGGWHVGKLDGEAFAAGTKIGAAALELYGKETAIEYDITFDANGGAFGDGKEKFVTKASLDAPKFEIPEKPTRKNYIFVSWDKMPGLFTQCEPVTYKAVWEPDPTALKVVYMTPVDIADKSKGYEEYDAFAIETGKALETPADPYFDGYTFLGWAKVQYATSGFVSAEEIAKIKMADEDIIYYAAFKANDAKTVTVTYNIFEMGYDGKYPETLTRNDYEDNAVEKSDILAANYVVPEGFTLDVEKSDASVVAAEGASLNIYLKRNQYPIKYYLNAQDETPVYTQNVYYGDSIVLLDADASQALLAKSSDDAVKYGSDFKFWDYAWTDENMPAKELKVVAEIAPAKYTVTFVRRLISATGSQKDKTISIVSSYKFGDTCGEGTIPSECFKAEGYKHTDWLLDGETVSIPYTIGKDTPREFTICSVFEIEYYNVSFYEDSAAETAGTAIKTCKLPYDTEIDPYYPADPEKKGYTFMGWDIEGGVLGAEDMSIVGQWKINQYAYSFISDGVEYKGGIVDYGTEISTLVPEKNPTSGDLIFGGWSKTPGGSAVSSYGKIDVVTEEVNNNIFYAVFTDKPIEAVAVTFYDFDGSIEHGPATGSVKEAAVYECGKSIKSGECTIGSEIVFPEAPTLDHYTFIGWFDKSGKEWKSGEVVPSAALDLYAKYARVRVALIPVEGAPTQIERGSTSCINDASAVDTYVAGTSDWFIYGLKNTDIKTTTITKDQLLKNFITVSGDGSIEVELSNTRFAGTGTVVTVRDNVTGEVVESFHLVIFGDVDGNGKVDSNDANTVNAEALHTTKWSQTGDTYVGYKVKAANVDGGRGIKAQDANTINYQALKVKYIDQVTGRIA